MGLRGGTDPLTFEVYDTSNNLLATPTGLPDFLGIVSDVAIGRIFCNDPLTSGGMTVTELKVVPVPTAVLLGILGLGTAGMKLRKKKEA